jgi:hypothetical protein
MFISLKLNFSSMLERVESKYLLVERYLGDKVMTAVLGH